jgi:hypothetical protein
LASRKAGAPPCRIRRRRLLRLEHFLHR